MRWNEFLDTANRLARGATEGDWRSAVSRGYYSVFHFFRDLLLANGVNIGQGGTSHFNLYSGLANCGDASVAKTSARSGRGPITISAGVFHKSRRSRWCKEQPGSFRTFKQCFPPCRPPTSPPGPRNT
jgi:hypothetical protein